ncbi:hypothetical protein ABIE52_000038 [Rhodococcus sp. OAS809]
MGAGQNGRVWDVVVVGGNSAGSSAALALARAAISRRRRLSSRNASAQAERTFLGVERGNPLTPRSRGREESSSDGVQIISTRIVQSAATNHGFEIIRTAAGVPVTTKTVTGVEKVDNQLTCMRLQGGEFLELAALAVPSLTRLRIGGFDEVGLEMSAHAAAAEIVADVFGHKSVPGGWSGETPSIPACRSGTAVSEMRVVMTTNTELIFKDADRAVEDNGTAGQQ